MAKSKDAGGDSTGSDPGVQKANRIIRNQLRQAIRKVWTRYSPERQEALYRAKRTKKRLNKDGSISKRPDVVYVCAHCGGEFKAHEVQVDHREPLGKTPDFPVTLTSLRGWHEWFGKLFCSVDNLQCLCKGCHLIKTNLERKQNRGG